MRLYSRQPPVGCDPLRQSHKRLLITNDIAPPTPAVCCHGRGVWACSFGGAAGSGRRQQRHWLFTLKSLPGRLQLTPELADPPGRHIEQLGHGIRGLAGRQQFRDCSLPLGQQFHPRFKINPDRRDVRRTAGGIFHQDLLPCACHIVDLSHGDQFNPAAELAVVARDVVDVEFTAHPTACTRLGDRIAGERSRRDHLRLASLDEALVGGEGIGDDLLDGLVTVVWVHPPEDVKGIPADWRQEPQKIIWLNKGTGIHGTVLEGTAPVRGGRVETQPPRHGAEAEAIRCQGSGGGSEMAWSIEV